MSNDNKSTSNFKEIVRKINEQKILLPDFQRGFVWKDEEQQKMIVASVLARMPVGSVLLLESKPNEYISKIIGLRQYVDVSDDNEKVEFLIDGQQRITVLTNVFSNTIFDKCRGFSDLAAPNALKRRFFLRIPKWNHCEEEFDIFGIRDLNFRYRDVRSKEPDFLSGDIYPFIEVINFVNKDNAPFNPQVPLSNELDNFCITYSSGYLIPLFLVVSGDFSKNRMLIDLHLRKILEKIAANIGDEIKYKFSEIEELEDKKEFVKKFFKEEYVEEEYTEEKFFELIINRQTDWADNMKGYLNACLEEMALNQIVVSESQRARAIDIYENLNRGGVSLNTFDLIMARVATVRPGSLFERIVSYIEAEKEYKKDMLPDVIKVELENYIDRKIYNATIATKCYLANKHEIHGKYIDAFLDVLALYCNNEYFVPEKFNLEYMKRKHILQLKPEDIDKNTEKICIALDRALFFFQTRCGIRNIQEINYSLMLVLVATIFLNDDWFYDIKKHNALEAWYWTTIFSGEYAKDQNSTMIKHLNMFMHSFQDIPNYDWILSMKQYVLNGQNFSDEKLLLMEKVDEDRVPKGIIRHFMCQYFLAHTYTDMFDENKRISVFSTEAGQLEEHHIIPLGSVKKVGESTKKLRNEGKHICNSPLNFVYITDKANVEISDEPIATYAEKINKTAKSKLHIPSYVEPKISEEKIRDILRHRYTDLKGEMDEHIKLLIKMS